MLASISSFFAFVAGAAVPILPYVFGAGSLAFTLSAVLSAGALAVVGALVGAMSGVNIGWGATRMVLAGSVAASVTYGVGTLIGVSVS
jgi:VIT1/CCC1 family predicted Fe2+/Mn2+ transporter